METHRPFCHYYEKNKILWFRIFGYGICIRNINKLPILFSERTKLSKGLLIKNFFIKTLNAY